MGKGTEGGRTEVVAQPCSLEGCPFGGHQRSRALHPRPPLRTGGARTGSGYKTSAKLQRDPRTHAPAVKRDELDGKKLPTLTLD